MFSFHVLRAPFDLIFFLTPNSRHSEADVRGALFVLPQHVKSPMRPRQKDVLLPAPNSRHPAADVRAAVVCVLLPRATVRAPLDLGKK